MADAQQSQIQQAWFKIQSWGAVAKTRFSLWRQRRPFVFWASTLIGLPILAAALAVSMLIASVWLGFWGRLPSRETVKNVETPEASYLFDRKGNFITRYYDQNREMVDVEEISPVLLEALLSTEDSRFFQHSGVDWQATARAIWYSGVRGQEEQGGGSTLSQQLAKNHFPRQGRGKVSLLISKIKEAITAQRFEKEYSKQELLALYLNTVPFGENIYGVKLASRRFFDVDPLNLKTEEAAVLVGMLKANSNYHPVWHPEAAVERRNVVLRRMTEQEFLEPEVRDSLTALPLVLKEAKEKTRAQASYFSDRVKLEVEALLADKRDVRGNPYTVGKSGLRIYSTLDDELQTLAEGSLRAHLADLQPNFREQWKQEDPDGFAEQLEKAIPESARWKDLIANGSTEAEAMASFGESRKMVFAEYSAFGAKKMKSSYRDSLRAELLRLRAGFVVADYRNGDVLAYVGGSDHFAVPYNSATAKRQVGSTFKPLVYAVAVERGHQPCDYFKNEKKTFDDGKEGYTPENADGRYGGEYSMTGALVKSVNTIAVSLIEEVGVSRVQELAQEMGLSDIPRDLSAALGTASLNIEEMLKVYGTFARGGTVPQYRMVTRIETREGKIIYSAPAVMETEQIMSPITASTLDYMLRQVARRGTGSDLAYRYQVESEVAGKTGTTQDQADGWFLGYTSNLVFGAWVGAAYPNIRWKSLAQGQGSKTAMPIAGKFLRGYEQDRGVSQLPEISEEDRVRYQCSDRRWESYDPYYQLEEGEYVPGEGFDESGQPLPPPDPEQANTQGPEEGEEKGETRGRDDPERVREREENNEELEQRDKDEREGRVKRAIEKIFKRPDQE